MNELINVVLWRIDSFGHLTQMSVLKDTKSGIFKLKKGFEYITNNKMVELRRNISDFTLQKTLMSDRVTPINFDVWVHKACTKKTQAYVA